MDTDAELMRRALALAATARRRTPPNPWVGCLLVRDGEVVGEGATQPPGGPHAEVEALRAAGDRARGATAYATLEPCSHHGRTPPCTDALHRGGRRPGRRRHRGPRSQRGRRGHRRTSARHGITVDVGVEAEAATRLLAPYLVHRVLGTLVRRAEDGDQPRRPDRRT